jgi:hypothetical protein
VRKTEVKNGGLNSSQRYGKKEKKAKGRILGILCIQRANLSKVVVEKRSIGRRNRACQKVEDGLITPSAYKTQITNGRIFLLLVPQTVHSLPLLAWINV